MNVNIYYAGFQKRAGGAFFHVPNITRGLQDLGHTVSVITLDRLPLFVRFLPHLLERLGNLVFAPFGFLWKQQFIRLLYRFFYRNSAEIDIFEDIYTYWPSRSRSIVILHALWSDNLHALNTNDERRKMLERIEARIINKIDAKIITVSAPYRDFLLSRLLPAGMRQQLDVVELGVDVNRFQPVSTGKPESIIFVGLLEARKNVMFLLQVFQRLIHCDNRFSLTIIGDGAQRQDLLNYCSSNQLSVTFLGRLSNDEVLRELPKHGIYLHTSVKESFSYSLLEAKLSGLKTVAFAQLEVPEEFIDIKVSRFEVTEWVDKILAHASVPGLRFDSERFSYQNMTKRTLELL